MKRIMAFAATSMVAVAALAGCSMDSPANSPAAGSADSSCKGAKIAYITSATSVSFWRSLSLGIKDAAEEKDATVTDYDSDNSQGKQLQNAQDAITSGVDLIIFSPTDSASAPAVLDVAEEAGVPVVIADIGTEEGEYVSLIKTDNTAAAQEAGEYLVEQLQAAGHSSGDIAIIGISQTRQNGKDRTAGFSKPVEEAGYTIVPLLESADYTRSESLGFTQDLLAGNPDLIGLFTQHDEATQGAQTALDGADEPIAVGFDGSPDTLQSLKDGTLAGAAMQQPVLMGQKAFSTACSFLDGEKVEKEVTVETILVTRENVLEIESDVQDTVFKE
ncbi:ribose ABC transporter substrate-binding protein [Mycetocola manganoxydans]|uniref:Ribose ABC transporter substrate-binding protein n=1 Tax=Mycetocola manganoxydans TaxID=699879 RepID=A0A3L6ZKF4_9MICO|nr:substrate-binding domain-containing protein [Mycetocola manganoxydans]RLP68317.1 ribose ABC transporter substrate-binding protein [Mycetocola manganoxydans]GHD43686.1 D-ribose ABC transporter substrate-binding protein [Mycetocola manganoxydans]